MLKRCASAYAPPTSPHGVPHTSTRRQPKLGSSAASGTDAGPVRHQRTGADAPQRHAVAGVQTVRRCCPSSWPGAAAGSRCDAERRRRAHARPRRERDDAARAERARWARQREAHVRTTGRRTDASSAWPDARVGGADRSGPGAVRGAPRPDQGARRARAQLLACAHPRADAAGLAPTSQLAPAGAHGPPPDARCARPDGSTRAPDAWGSELTERGSSADGRR